MTVHVFDTCKGLFLLYLLRTAQIWPVCFINIFYTVTVLYIGKKVPKKANSRLHQSVQEHNGGVNSAS